VSSDAVVFRPFDAIVVVGATWAVVVSAVVGVAALVVGADENRGVFWTLVGVAAAGACARAVYRVRVEVDDDEIRIFNFVSSKTVPWSTVAQIDVVRSWLSPTVLITRRAAVRVTTLKGEQLVIDASTLEVPQTLDVLERFDPRAIGT
jgi:hypothetical protein